MIPGPEFDLVDNEGYPANQSGYVWYRDSPLCFESGYFDDNAASAICRILGYDAADSWDYSPWSGIANFAKLTKISCTNEKWSSCTYSDNSICEGSDVISLSCKCESS